MGPASELNSRACSSEEQGYMYSSDVLQVHLLSYGELHMQYACSEGSAW